VARPRLAGCARGRWRCGTIVAGAPLFFVLLVAASGARAQAPAQWPAFTAQLNAYVAADSIVGAAALVMKDGRVLAHHEVGYGDRALGQKVDTNTIFHWGSMTKTLTAIAVMQMVQEGRLSLDARVTSFIPELRRVHAPAGSSMDDITVRMLLSHSSGLQNGTWPYGRGRPWEPFEPTTWEQLVAMMPYSELGFKPDAKYSYSNPAFIYLARIVQDITGDPWEAYVQKNIFTPLGLTRSYFNLTPRHLAPYRSNNYTLQKDSGGAVRVAPNGRDFNPGITTPNGGWNSPLGDVARYVAFLTGAASTDVSTRGEPPPRGESATRALYETIIPHATLERMWEPRFPMSADSSGEWMGLSFFIERFPGGVLVGHTGSQAGFRSFFYWNPATRAAVVMAVNTNNEIDGRASSEGFRKLIAAAKVMLK
jgi:CubicO group peptidase (beta-lactamase class C family)